MTRSVYSDEYKLFRRLLIEERKKAGLVQSVLAEKLNRPLNFVSKYENGERRLDIVEFFEIAAAIGFDPLKFLKTWQNNQ